MLAPRPLSGQGTQEALPSLSLLPEGPLRVPRPVAPAGSWHLIPACSSLGTHPALTVSLCSLRSWEGSQTPVTPI